MTEHLLGIPVLEVPRPDRSTPRRRVYGNWGSFMPEHPTYDAVHDHDWPHRLRELRPRMEWRRPVYETWRDTAGREMGERVGWQYRA
jgi:hypothetical protein